MRSLRGKFSEQSLKNLVFPRWSGSRYPFRRAGHLSNGECEGPQRNAEDGATLHRSANESAFSRHRRPIHEEAIRNGFPSDRGADDGFGVDVADLPTPARDTGGEKGAVLKQTPKRGTLSGLR